MHYEEAARLRQEMSEKASLAERRSNALQGEMEEARSLLDSADRGKRQTETELSEARNAVTEMNGINSRAAAEKRSVEGALHALHAEIEDMLNLAKGSEEKAKGRFHLIYQWIIFSFFLMVFIRFVPKLN